MALDAVDVIWRDGRTLRLRPPTASDADATVAFFSELSDRSRYLRFHGLAEISRNVVRPYLEPDWDERGALVATASDDGTAERIVALASYERLRDATTAECAFAVSDAMQGVGIGTRLLEQLAARAAAQGIQTFVAEVMGDNHGALTVFMEVGFAIDRKSEDGVVELRFPITSTEAYRERVDERDHVAVAASLEPFFTAKSVAVVGASRRTGSIGGDIFRNIIDADFTGTAYPVNGSGDPFAGVHGYTSIAEIGEPIDLAILAVPAARIIDAARGALECGVRALCVITSGFAEVGGDGRALEGELLALARAHGARLVGPNCLGIASTAVRLNATFAARPLPPGRIGFASQSGALGLALLERATERRLGFSSFVSIGNKADVSSNDLLEWWEEDDATDSILLYIESFGNPQKFGRVARRVARHKPILALKAGTTTAGARAASSHTAALTNSDTAVDALFRQAGVLRAQTLEELIDAASLLSSQPLPHGPRVAVVTNAGGLGILAADACEAAGLTLPSLSAETREALAKLVPAEASLANPIDILGSATPEIFEAVIPPILADAGIDALMVLFAQPIVADAEDVAAAVVRAAGMVAHEKPIVASMISANGTPCGTARCWITRHTICLPRVGCACARVCGCSARLATPASWHDSPAQCRCRGRSRSR